MKEKKYATPFVIVAIFCGVLAGGGAGFALGIQGKKDPGPVYQREGFKICYRVATMLQKKGYQYADAKLDAYDICEEFGYDNLAGGPIH